MARKFNLVEPNPSIRSHGPRTVAGVVLCGGRGRRMGLDKAWLPWHDGWALARIGEALAERCEPILLVKRPGRSLPPTPKFWLIADDDEPGAGPLAALATVHRTLTGTCDACLVATCDQSPATLSSAIAAILKAPSAEATLFLNDERRQPFPGLYSMTALSAVVDLRASGAESMRALVETLGERVEVLPPPAKLTDWDDRAAYLAAARGAGFEPPAWCHAAAIDDGSSSS